MVGTQLNKYPLILNEMDLLIGKIDQWMRSRNIRFYRESVNTPPESFRVCLYCVDHYHVISIYATGQNYWLMAVYDVNDVEDGSPKIDYFIPGNLTLFYGVVSETLDTMHFLYRKVRENAWTNRVVEIEGIRVDEILDMIRDVATIGTISDGTI